MFTPDNRLARFFDDPNGVLYAHALQRATANLGAARSSLLTAVDMKLGALIEHAAAPPTAETEAMLYRLASDLIADAGAAGLNELSRAAHSLCDLLTSVSRGANFVAALQVHVSALVALRQPASAQAQVQRAAILTGLVRLSQKCDL